MLMSTPNWLGRLGQDQHLRSEQDRKSLDSTPMKAIDWIGRNGTGPARKAIWSGFSGETVLTMLKEACKGIAAQFSTIN